MLKLYHGSNVVIDKIDLCRSRKGKDFGCGFYLNPNKAQAMEIIVAPKSLVAFKTLTEADLPKECLVCAVVHDGEAVVPSGSTRIYPNDRVVVFVQSEATQKVIPIFEGR